MYRYTPWPNAEKKKEQLWWIYKVFAYCEFSFTNQLYKWGNSCADISGTDNLTVWKSNDCWGSWMYRTMKLKHSFLMQFVKHMQTCTARPFPSSSVYFKSCDTARCVYSTRGCATFNLKGASPLKTRLVQGDWSLFSDRDKRSVWKTWNRGFYFAMHPWYYFQLRHLLCQWRLAVLDCKKTPPSVTAGLMVTRGLVDLGSRATWARNICALYQRAARATRASLDTCRCCV